MRWWRGEELLADSEADEKVSEPKEQAGSRPRVKMWDNRSLEIAHVRPEDGGEYRCRASRPEPWGDVTQVHHVQIMCEYATELFYCHFLFATFDRFRSPIWQRETITTRVGRTNV